MKFDVARRLAWLGTTALLSACSFPGAGGDPPQDGASNQDPSGNGAAQNGNGNGSGQAGPGGGATGGFKVSGRMASALGTTSHTLDLPGGGVEAAKHVTHVIGVTPSSQNTRRVVAEVKPSGEFTLDLDPSRLWVLVFVDASKVGTEMIAGVFRAKGLDTLAPLKKGTADLGEIKAKDGVAEAALSYDALLSALGVDATSALYLSSVDDMCLRVVNPDVDGNGKIDALEGDAKGAPDFRLDFHVQFGMRTDHQVSIDDMVGAFLPDTVTLSYGGTGIYTSFPARAFADGWQSTAWSSFDEVVHYAPMGGMGPGAPRSTEPPAQVPRADMSVSGYGDHASLGLMAVPGFDLPQGKYRFGIDGTTLTFAGIRTPTDSQLAAAESFIMPFVKLVPSDESCTTACALSKIEYEWRKRTDGGWIAATAGEVALIAGEQGGFLSIRLGNDANKSAGWVIPGTAVSGSVAWSASVNPDAATKAAVAVATTADLCHVGLSYDDKLGMRYFGGIGNAPHTCGAP